MVDKEREPTNEKGECLLLGKGESERERKLFVSWDYIIFALGRIRLFFKITNQLTKLPNF